MKKATVPKILIHPLYLELQKKSPLCPFCGYDDFNVSEIDLDTSTIGKHEFYKKYLSKSLPLVFRNGARNWKLTKEIKAKLYDSSALRSYLQTFFDKVVLFKSLPFSYTLLQRNTGIENNF